MAKFIFQDYKSESIDKSPGQLRQNFTTENEQILILHPLVKSVIHWSDDTHTVALDLFHNLIF